MTLLSPHNFSSLSKKKILVTGASGFIGSHLVRGLLAQGCQVTVMVRPSTNLWRLHDILGRITTCLGDLSRLNFVEYRKKLANIQIVYHLAAAGVDQTKTNSMALLETNVTGTVRMLELARLLKVERFIHCGSCFEYQEGSNLSEEDLAVPVSEYGVSKLSGWMLAEMFYHNYQVPVVSLRPFTVYGPFEGQHRLIPQVINSILEGIDIKLTGGEQARDFVFGEDVVSAFLSAAVAPNILGETFNIATGKATSIKEIVALILDLMDAKAGPSRPLFGAIPYRSAELWSLAGNPKKARQKLGWSAGVSLEEGLRKTIEWFKANKKRYPVYGSTLAASGPRRANSLG